MGHTTIMNLLVVMAAMVLLLGTVMPRGAMASQAKCAEALGLLQKPVDNSTLVRAIKMHAQNGHGNYAFTQGGLVDIGSWRGCGAIENTRYCTVFDNVTSLGLAACAPVECTAEYLENLPRSLVVGGLGLTPFIGLPNPLRASCPSRPPLPSGGKWCLFFVALLGAAVVVGTLLDLQINHDIIPIGRMLRGKSRPVPIHIPTEIPDTPAGVDQMWIDPRTGEPSGVYGSGKAPAPSEDELLYLGASAPASTNPLHDTYEAIKRAPIFQPLLAFSFISNIKKLFGRPASEDMPVLNGIRVLSLFWVIMGHTYIGVFSTPLMNAQITLDILQRFRFQVLYGGFFAVDSFFLMSGFLVAYLFIGQVRKHGIKSWTMPLYYFHRLWRLLPSVAFMVFLLWQVVPYVAGNGPVWHHMVAPITSSCSENWWKTLLFINNFYLPYEQCAPWTWYLANDVQFYFLAPFVFMAYLHHKSVGWTLTFFLFIGSIVANMVTSIEFDLVAYPLLNSLGLGEPVEVSAEASTNVMANIYFLPWTRCGPYLVGFMMAYILLEKGEHYSVPAGIRIISLALSGLVIVVLIFITYTEANFGWKSQAISVIWFSFSRQVWAIALGTWILFMIWGFGGPIRKFLSLRIWVPLARLSFSAYLWQSVVIGVFFSAFTFPFDYSEDIMLYFWLSMILVSYCCAVVNYFLLEKPLMNIEKALLTTLKR